LLDRPRGPRPNVPSIDRLNYWRTACTLSIAAIALIGRVHRAHLESSNRSLTRVHTVCAYV